MKRIFSGVQPSGIIHIGNYLGAIKRWVELQDHVDESIFCVVDLHAITVRQDPKKLKENTLRTAALYLACGIDPKKSKIFIQSSRPEHTELMWILSTLTSVGELTRMTQYKEKSGQFVMDKEVEKIIEEANFDLTGNPKDSLKMLRGVEAEIKERIEAGANAGLLTYPILMAADILLYGATHVPVGDDQKQHLELTRNLAQRYNRRYKDVFTIPEPLIEKNSSRIMGLDDPLKKMSKSSKSVNNYIAITDDKDTIKKKIMRAVTDSGTEIKFGPERPAISNLLNIFSAVSGIAIPKLEQKYSSGGYAKLKEAVAEAIISHLEPIQERYEKIIRNKQDLEDILNKSSREIAPLASKTITQVKEGLGMWRA